MSRMRAAMWSVSIGVLSVVVAAALVWLLQQNRAAVGFLYGSVFVVCVVSGLVVELPRGVGAAGGAVAAVLVAAILGVTIAAAPLGPGAQRPGLPDLLWKPLFALIAAIALAAGIGWSGLGTGLRLARRRRGPTVPPV